MKVKRLKKILENLPDNMEIRIESGGCDPFHVESIKPEKIFTVGYDAREYLPECKDCLDTKGQEINYTTVLLIRQSDYIY